MDSMLKNSKMVSLTVVLLITIAGCQKSGTIPAEEKYFITGECLKSELLQYDVYNQIPSYGVDSCMINSDRIVLPLSFDMEYSKEVVSQWNGRTTEYRYVPSEAAFHRFVGANPEKVRSAFEEIYNRANQESRPIIYLSTVFYDGGLELVADRDFAGIPAGDNLAPILRQQGSTSSPSNYTEDLFPKYSDLPVSRQFPVTGQFVDMAMVPPVFSLLIPVNGHKVVHKTIHFQLTIPVKSVNYLQWLNATMDDPAAPMPYEERVLHCSFSTRAILQ